MIDQTNIRALLARINDCTKLVNAADRSGVLQYIDALLAELEAAAADKRDAWHMVCGDWRDETVALHGANGHIASGLTVEQARAIIAAHDGTSILEGAFAQQQDNK